MSLETGKLTIGIFLFDDVEVLDFCGPFEVFSVAGHLKAMKTNKSGTQTAITVYHLAASEQLVKAVGNFLVQPHYPIEDHLELDVLIILGGDIWATTQQEAVRAWVKKIATRVPILGSVCTGTFILGKAGLLSGPQATTHYLGLDRLAEMFPQTEDQRDVRWVDKGNLVTSASIEAGIDMSLHLVERLLGVKWQRKPPEGWSRAGRKTNDNTIDDGFLTEHPISTMPFKEGECLLGVG